MWKSLASNMLTVLMVLFLTVGAVGIWGKQKYMAQGPLSTAICVQVPSGSNMRKVADQLDDNRAVSSVQLYRIGTEYSGLSDQLKAGNFLIPAGASMYDIAQIVTTSGADTCGSEILYRIGVNSASVELRKMQPTTATMEQIASFGIGQEEPDEYNEFVSDASVRLRVAIAEGVTSWQIFNVLNEVSQLQGEISNIPAEGSLAPDSYEFKRGDDRGDLLARMAQRQDQILQDAWGTRQADLPLNTLEEALILASIIEKETGVSSERATISSVFINRLNKGMLLQTDPTVIYGITRGKGVLGRGLRQSELKKDTPWNTYVNRGLPPTPIANPGRASIEAALNPVKSDFLFFVADGTGGHAFSKTLREHNQNVAKWRAIEAQKNN